MQRSKKTVYLFLMQVVASSCFQSNSSESATELLTLMSSKETGIDFANNVVDSSHLNVFSYRNFYHGGGVGIGDINNDNLPDVYLIGNLGKNKLFLNKGNLQFEDITTRAGVAGSKTWTTGISIIDVNADGFLDLYVSNAGNSKEDDQKNELFINNGNLTFTEKAVDYGLDEAGNTTHTAFFDYDLDGDLDVYILNNSIIPVNSLNFSGRRDLYAEDWPVSELLKGGGDKLLRNDHNKFIDVSKNAGILGSLIGFGLGVTIGDINNDSYPDIYVSNDFFERDYLYINQTDGTFSEEIMSYIGHMSLSSMGADMADLNNDGFPEIFVTEMLPMEDARIKTNSSFESYNVYLFKQSRGFYNQYMHNTLQLNNGNGSFSEIAWYSGVAATDWSWGALIFDVNNDGYRDIYISNGTQRDVLNQDFIGFFANEVLQKMVISGKKEDFQNVIKMMPQTPIPNKLYLNGGDLKFTDAAQKGLMEAIPSFSNGSAYGDLDDDGDYDLIVNNVNDQAFVYRNNSEQTGNHYLKVKLRGSTLNPFAVGSKLKGHINKEIIYAELIPTRGFQSSVDYAIVLGLGKADGIDSLEITWTDSSISMLYDVPVDTTIAIGMDSYTSDQRTGKRSNALFFESVEHNFKALQEDNYVDFYGEGLVIRMLSREGPRFDVGDLNGDGLDDVYIGGPANSPGLLYFQKENGFELSSQSILQRSTLYEDTYVRFIDVDNDSDLDVFVGSGGNMLGEPLEKFEDRIYLNDGQGNLTHNEEALPERYFNTSVVVPFDVNQDGFTDLFVGSRSIPGNYGKSPSSFVFRNEGDGTFKDMTSRYLPDFKKPGLITDAAFGDISGDGNPELILVGEWMTPHIFTFHANKFEKVKTTLDTLSGWWNTVTLADIDRDGDQDLVLGNRGDNFYFSGSMKNPIRLWLSDFDNNGTEDKIITRLIEGKDKPVYTKSELAGQLNFIKKNNIKHADYATQGMTDLFTDDALALAEVKEATWFKSVIVKNNGQMNFDIVELPKEVQFSSVNDVLLHDIDADGDEDLIMIGNDSNFMPQFSRLDASYGHLLLNDGLGRFKWIPNRESGLFVRGDSKQLSKIRIDEKVHFLITRNQDNPILLTGVDRN